MSQLNDSTAEYIVSVKKHFYDRYIVVQYGVKNTLEDQKLSKVNLKVLGFTTEQNVKVEGVVPIPEEDSIAFNEQKFVYVLFNRQASQEPYPTAKIQQKLTFVITEIDVDSQEEVGSYDEEYDIPEVSIAIRDYIKPDLVPQG